MIYLKNDIDSNLYKYTKNNDMGKYVRNMYDIGKTNKSEHGLKLGLLSKYLTLSTLDKGVQIVIINNPDDYLEYAPYKYIDNEVEFISRVFEM